MNNITIPQRPGDPWDDIAEAATQGTGGRIRVTELSDWKGTVTANKQGRYRRPETGDVWVTWHAGNVPARDGNSGLPSAGWIEATALTIAGECPDCARPANFVQAGNYWDRPEGWHHDSKHDLMTCWAGKAEHERRYGRSE